MFGGCRDWLKLQIDCQGMGSAPCARPESRAASGTCVCGITEALQVEGYEAAAEASSEIMLVS